MYCTSPGRGPYPRRFMACRMAWSWVNSVMGSLPLNFLSRSVDSECSPGAATGRSPEFVFERVSWAPALAYGTPTAKHATPASATVNVEARNHAPHASSRFRIRNFLFIEEAFRKLSARNLPAHWPSLLSLHLNPRSW